MHAHQVHKKTVTPAVAKGHIHPVMLSGIGCGLLIIQTPSGVLGIYEEQAGENDWHSEFVSQPFETEVLRKDHVVVATSLNVLAALRLNSGSVSWRQILQESDQLQSFTVLTKPSVVISLSSSGTVLRAWRSDDGALLWEQQLLSATAAANAAVYTLPEANAGSGEGIAVVAAGTIWVCLKRQQMCILPLQLVNKQILCCCRSTQV